VHLRDPGFRNTKDEADLLHGRFLVVVKGHDQTLAFGQVVDRLWSDAPHFGVQVTKLWIVFGSGRHVDQILFH
jgi:hypothetical protein